MTKAVNYKISETEKCNKATCFIKNDYKSKIYNRWLIVIKF